MAVTLTGADGLFTILGKVAHALNVHNTARLTTVPTEVIDIIDQFNSVSVTADVEKTIDGLAQAIDSYQQSGGGLASSLRSFSRQFLVELVHADNALPRKSLTAALEELISQMDSSGDSVDASAVTAPVTTGASNQGDGVIVTSTKRPDGLVQENILAEDIEVEATSSGEGASLRFQGERSESDRLSEQWPNGSGSSRSIGAVVAGADGILTNGDFDDETDTANAPDSWIVVTGQIATTIAMTDTEVQTVAISGTPTSGHYLLHVDHPRNDIKSQTTAPIAYNATSSTVQSALRALKGFEDITVAESGTGPNYTHTVTFTGVAGNIAEMTSTSHLNTGSIAHATTTQGSANAYVAKALEFNSDGAELTEIMQRVTLQPLTQYAVNFWVLVDVVPAAGVLTIDLYNGSGTVSDEQGVANSFTVDLTALTTSFAAQNGVFRTPRRLDDTVYLRIRITTALSATTSLFIDHLAMTEMTELYSGGPYAAVFNGQRDWQAGDAQNPGDTFTITTTNDRGGEFQEFFHRVYDMAGKVLLLPSNSSGAETISDGLIA